MGRQQDFLTFIIVFCKGDAICVQYQAGRELEEVGRRDDATQEETRRRRRHVELTERVSHMMQVEKMLEPEALPPTPPTKMYTAHAYNMLRYPWTPTPLSPVHTTNFLMPPSSLQ